MTYSVLMGTLNPTHSLTPYLSQTYKKQLARWTGCQCTILDQLDAAKELRPICFFSIFFQFLCSCIFRGGWACCQYQCKWLAGKTHLRNYMCCFGRLKFKPYWHRPTYYNLFTRHLSLHDLGAVWLGDRKDMGTNNFLQ